MRTKSLNLIVLSNDVIEYVKPNISELLTGRCQRYQLGRNFTNGAKDYHCVIYASKRRLVHAQIAGKLEEDRWGHQISEAAVGGLRFVLLYVISNYLVKVLLRCFNRLH